MGETLAQSPAAVSDTKQIENQDEEKNEFATDSEKKVAQNHSAKKEIKEKFDEDNAVVKKATVSFQLVLCSVTGI